MSTTSSLRSSMRISQPLQWINNTRYARFPSSWTKNFLLRSILCADRQKRVNPKAVNSRTLPVNLWIIHRETVTVAVLFMHPALVTTPVKAMGGILNDFAWFDEGGDCSSQFDWFGLARLKSVRFSLPDASASRLAPPSDQGFLPDKLTTRKKSSRASGIRYVSCSTLHIRYSMEIYNRMAVMILNGMMRLSRCVKRLNVVTECYIGNCTFEIYTLEGFLTTTPSVSGSYGQYFDFLRR